MKLKHSIVSLSICLIVSISVKGQSSLSTYSLANHPSSLSYNPAWVPQDKFVIGLPFVSESYFQSRSNEFVLSSFVQPNPDSSSLELTPNAIVDDLSQSNYQNVHLSWQWASFGMRLGEKNFLSFSMRERLNFRSHLSPDLIEFMANGTANFMDQAAVFEPRIFFDWTREYSIGIARQVNDKLNVGARLHLIDGIANIHTEEFAYVAKFNGEFNDFVLNGDAHFQTAGMSPITRNDSFRLFSTTPMRGNGSGFGVDFGLTYQVNDDLHVSTSILGLGKITWKRDVKQITAQTQDYGFQGFDILDFVDEGFGTGTTDAGAELQDSLMKILNVEDSNQSSYSTSRPITFYLSGQYALTDKIGLGVTYFYESAYERPTHALSLALPIQVSESFRINPSLNVMAGSFTNLGLIAAYRIKPFEVYLSTDNLPGLFLPQDFKVGSGMAGIYLVF
jgi:hypothetical protein